MASNDMVRGPKAPKDPTKKRSAVYIMVDSALEGRPTGDGKFMDVCYLEGRISAKLTSVCPELDKELAGKFQFCQTFREMVHSIGVTFVSQNEEDRELTADFSMNCKTETTYEGTSYRAKLPCNGQEVQILLSDYEKNEKDTVFTSFMTFFPKYMTGKMSICFYMNDGYKVPEVTFDPPIDFESDAYKKMIEKSLMHMGNVYRLKKAIEKARNGEDVTIAYIGGSITQGAAAKPISTDCYAYKSYEAFKKMFGKGNGDNVHYIKAGVGGTSSELGITRYNMDVLRYGTVEPDIVVIEFAVNDAGDETRGVCFESLSLMAYEGPGNPAVILLFSVFMDDFNLQDNLSRVGYHYDFPMVSVKDALVPQFYEATPIITKRQYFYDLFHPTNEGHRIMAESIVNLFKKADEAEMPKEDIVTDKECVIGNTYRKLNAFTRLDADKYKEVNWIKEGSFTEKDTELQCVEKDVDSLVSPEFPENWKHVGGSGSESFTMSINCKDLLIVFKDSGDRKFGKAKVLVDGKEVRELNPFEAGWNHCTALIIIKEDEVREHLVEVSLDPEDGSKDFTILGFGYTL